MSLGATPLLTYEDYAAIPNDGRRWELIDGELEVNPAPSSRHQTVSRRVQFELMRDLEETGRALIFDAPVDVLLSPHDVVQPDLALVSTARRHLVTARGIEGAPDVLVEILSPSTRTLDRRVKKATYARFGVPEYWIVDPDSNCIEQYRLTGATFTLHARYGETGTLVTQAFPDLAVDLQRVFRE